MKREASRPVLLIELNEVGPTIFERYVAARPAAASHRASAAVSNRVPLARGYRSRFHERVLRGRLGRACVAEAIAQIGHARGGNSSRSLCKQDMVVEFAAACRCRDLPRKDGDS